MSKIAPVEKTDPVPVPAVEPEAKEKDDPRYFVLKKPMMVGGKEVKRLLIDISEIQGGRFFILNAKFRNDYPVVYRTSMNKTGEDVFLGMMIAELNGIVVEDLYKLNAKVLLQLFTRTQNFLYSNEE